METLERAQNWVRAGYSVIPIRYKDKRPAFDALKLTGQEHGAGWGEYKRRAPTKRELWAWFGGPRRNLGIVTGFGGLVVIDFDNISAYKTWAAWAEGSDLGRLALISYTVTTRRGAHVYLQIEEEVTSFSVGAVDVKAQWGYVLAAGSVHPSGHIYSGTHGDIHEIPTLADAFPLAPEPRKPTPAPPRVTDPWASASNPTTTCGVSIDAVKARVTLQEVLGVSLDTQWIKCPIHADTEPSMRLYADGHYHCYGCAAHGDVIDLYAAMHKLTVREALAEMAGRL